MREALRTGKFVVVEGVVWDYKPAPAEGHAYEEFDVAGHQYSFSDYVTIAGYHKSQSHGGLIHEGLQVRTTTSGGRLPDWRSAERREYARSLAERCQSRSKSGRLPFLLGVHGAP